MIMPFIIGASQQKRRPLFNFVPYVAPDDFDRTAQTIDIYAMFENYYYGHRNAKYIYKIADSFTNSGFGGNNRHPLVPFHAFLSDVGFSFHYGYTLGGIDYVFDTKLTHIYSVTANTVTVTSTDMFPDTGIITAAQWGYYGGNFYFTYTSKDATHFYGTNYGLTPGWGGACGLVIDFTGTTKRWVITSHTDSFANFDCRLCQPGIEWAYTAKCRGIFTQDGNCVANHIKYVHCDSLDNITNMTLTYGGTMASGLLTGSLHLPTTITTIPAQFYRGNVNLTGTLTIPSNITTIGAGAFYNDMFDTIVSNSSNFNVTDYVLYDITGGTKVEANYAARGRSGTLTFRNDTTKILDFCCFNCTTKTGTALQSLSSTITYIGQYAFYYCSGLTGNIVIPNLVTILYTHTFRQCSGITGTLTFASTSSCTTIQSYCFSETKLSGDLTIPASMRTMDITSFYYCSYLKGSLTFEEGIQTFSTQTFSNGCVFTGTLTLPSTLTSIINPSAFTSTHNFDSIVITGSSVSYLAVDNILYDIKSSLKVAVASARNYSGTLTLESDTTEIGINAFFNCTKRTGALDIPNSVTKINSGSFYNCTGLNGALTIGTGLVNAIAAETFYLTNFSSITSSSSVIIAYDNVLYDEVTGGSIKAVICARGYSGTLTLKTGITEILTSAFYYCSNRTGSLTIPSTLTVKIPARAFGNCTGFNGALNFDCPTLTAHDQGIYTSFNNCPNFNALNICASYSSTWLNHNFCNNFSGASLNASSANITDGTKTWRIGATNKARMSAEAIAAALARGITIV